MAKKFKYDLEALEWDGERRRNKEGLYCYCGMDYNDGDPMLRCEGCQQLFHWDCVSCLKAKPLLGDTFYRFQCGVCNGSGGGDEAYERDVLSWVQVIYVVLYHLIQLEPEKSYFRWRENICATIGERWENLFPGKVKTATWHNTVAGCLSTHTSLFKSGFEETKQTGNWTLQRVVEPSKAHFKAPTRGREPGKPARREKAKRKATDTEREILDVLNEGKQAGGARRNARHRVSFSDDEDDEDDARRGRTKRRRPELRSLRDDPELLQSLELFTKLERQRLDGGQTAVKTEDELTEANGTKDATVPTSADTEPTTAATDVDAGSAQAGELDDADVLDECSSLSSWTSKASEGSVSPRMDADSGRAAAPQSTAHQWRRPISSAQEDRNAGKSRAVLEPRAGPATGQFADSVMAPQSVGHPTTIDTSADGAAINSCSGSDDGSSDDGRSSGDGASSDDDEIGGGLEHSRLALSDAADIWRTSLEGIEPRAMFSGERASQPRRVPMSEREQWELGARIGSSRVAMGSAVSRRLHRRLQLRRLRRVLGLRVFDIDSAVEQYMGRRQQPWWPGRDAEDSTPPEGMGGVAQAMTGRMASGQGSHAAAGAHAHKGPSLETASAGGPAAESGAARGTHPDSAMAGREDDAATTPYVHSFASRLMGRAVLRDSLTAASVRVSPFHGRRLRPFIWRDFRVPGDASGGGTRRTGLPMLHVLRAIRARKHPVFGAHGVEAAVLAGEESIDYVHFQPGHVQQANALLSRTFWPGIDVSEALQYPEFSIVALYRRRVIGCAFMTPDAYLTYVAVAAGWEGAGIAKYMVFHLTQALPTKDVTLHVSATNLAMLLYQQLGFKPETYVVGFYRDYLAEGSRVCPHAFFMRLRRY
ncbi:hypothetical protein LPJ61_000705 [Coemansia biformis]|uniref:N-acetyltransferase domain-containing protein n=1 Tax=Coemansia biformis TaxID=1286918 RepID=A0A9W8CYT6_9FUNG|nr:hypothetical protein LPJ61_000705 [Coemansia biformis]